MILIKKIKSKLNPNSKRKYKMPYGIFECPECHKTLERDYHNGIRQKTCGCISFRDAATRANLKHGEYRNNSLPSKIHNTWRSMIKRCYYKNDDSFKWYGERGIEVCDTWLDSYVCFRDWALLNGFKPGLKLDRKDNDGNYCPDNCQFITHLENSRKQTNVKLSMGIARSIRRVYKKGKNLTQQKIADHFGVSNSCICNIINNKIWKES